MTITLNQGELDEFMRDIDRCRFERESLLEKKVAEAVGEEVKNKIYEEFNEEAEQFTRPRLGGLMLP